MKPFSLSHTKWAYGTLAVVLGAIGPAAYGDAREPVRVAQTTPGETSKEGTGADEARRGAQERATGSSSQHDGEKPRTTDEDEEVPSKGSGHADLSGQIDELGNSIPVSNGPGAGPAKANGAAAPVMDEDNFIDLMLKSAPRETEYHDPKDRDTQIKWDQTLEREKDTERHLEHEFALLQGNVATKINAYLQAATTWQERFALISSSTTGLQGMLADWSEAKGIYEKADTAFALANLAMGVGKLGFKVFKWIKAPAAATAAVETAEAAGDIAKAGKGEAGAAEAAVSVTKETPKTPVAPGDMYAKIAKSGKEGRDLRTTGLGMAALDETSAATNAQVQYMEQVDKMQNLLAKAQKEGSKSVAQIQKDLAALKAAGPPGGTLTAEAAEIAKQRDLWKQAVSKAQTIIKDSKDPNVVKTAKSVLRRLKNDGIPTKLTGKAAEAFAAKSAAGATGEAAELAKQQAQWDRNVKEVRQLLDQAKASGNAADIADNQKQLDALLKNGRPTTVFKPPVASTPLELAQQAVGEDVLGLAKAEGVDVSGEVKALVGRHGDAAAVAETQEAVLRAIAKARGWHSVPEWGAKAIGDALRQARQTLAGVKGAAIEKANVEVLKSLKSYVESKGLNFAQWLETAASETEIAGEEVVERMGVKSTERIVQWEGISLDYDKADVNLILQLIDTDGDVAKLRAVASPVEQISLNALARADAATRAPGKLEKLAKAGADLSQTTNQAGAVQRLARPTDAQLHNVLEGTGQLGRVGLANAVDEFGVLERIKDKNIVSATFSEAWELFTSPSATTASYYYTLSAQSELLDLLQTQGQAFVDLGVQLDSAARALKDLQSALEHNALSGDNSYLGKKGPDELRKTLDDLKRIYDNSPEGWKKAHKDEMEARQKHIEQKLADMADALKQLEALDAKMKQLRQWLDSVRLNPDGSVRDPVSAFNPQTFVRLGSITLFLRGMASGIFGLTEDKPFHVIVPGEKASAPAPK